MESISSFSPEVCEQLKYYVYRLVDPRNGQTFYVGKGQGNRVFAHVNEALKANAAISESSDGKKENEENLKYKTIREIENCGLHVIHIIQTYGLDEKTALIIESALIDVYSLKQLTNKNKGFDSIEPQNALTLQRDLCAPEYEDSPDNPKYMIIKVKNYWLSQRADRYETTRSAWKLDINKVAKYPYVLSVTGGIVKEVYKVSEWHNADSSRNGRIEFTGTVAEDDVRNIFINKKTPEKYRKKGQANPCLFCKPDKKQ